MRCSKAGYEKMAFTGVNRIFLVFSRFYMGDFVKHEGETYMDVTSMSKHPSNFVY